MASYTRTEARAWARNHLNGVANVTIPTLTDDFRALNERAIRHDVETSIAHGFVATLACSEVAISLNQHCRRSLPSAVGIEVKATIPKIFASPRYSAGH
jgi:4-hydroxy-tetrahydrodipicolinate synthase